MRQQKVGVLVFDRFDLEGRWKQSQTATLKSCGLVGGSESSCSHPRNGHCWPSCFRACTKEMGISAAVQEVH